MTIRQISIPGNSGCKVELEYEPTARIRKTVLNLSYAARLEKQRIKQQTYAPLVPGIVIPKVLDYDEVSFCMEYLPMLDAIEFLERATPAIIQTRLKILFDLISWELSNSNPVSIPKTVILEKVKSIQGTVPENIWAHYFNDLTIELYKRIPDRVILPLGQCHGDLTYSNIMFSLDENCIGLIDFLDSFIETPLMDLVKLRQDTHFHWTSYRYPERHDRGKVYLANLWIDQLLNDEFGSLLTSNEFWILEVLNYLRIAPYFDEQKDYEYLYKAVRTLFDKEPVLCM